MKSVDILPNISSSCSLRGLPHRVVASTNHHQPQIKNQGIQGPRSHDATQNPIGPHQQVNIPNHRNHNTTKSKSKHQSSNVKTIHHKETANGATLPKSEPSTNQSQPETSTHHPKMDEESLTF
ncbi:hypothetical protein Dimus_038077 [Dionaea muscipula]